MFLHHPVFSIGAVVCVCVFAEDFRLFVARCPTQGLAAPKTWLLGVTRDALVPGAIMLTPTFVNPSLLVPMIPH